MAVPKKAAPVRWRWVVLGVAALLAPMALLTAARAGLVGYQRPDEVVVGRSDMLGTWKDGYGMTLYLGPDHRATADGIPGTALCERDGTWMFYVRRESGAFVSDRSAVEGQVASAAFGESSDCAFELSVFRIHGEYVLCTVDDPDSYCTDRELLHKTPEPDTPAAMP
ncbi:hypothetical protein ACFV6F_15845 [Kitasatospora phosalacinea]|uniref:hypothetical protein n=1 Tax=Kitasatospora phosalacinea TaxID=2065 RepID=UPI0036621DA7